VYLTGATTVVPGSRKTVLRDLNTGLLYTTPDYRSSPVAAWAGAPALNSAVALADASVYGHRIVGTDAEIVHVLADGSSSVVATLPAQYLAYLTSNASRSAIVGPARLYGFVVWDGTTWGKLDFPPGLDAADFGRLVVTDETA
jgi:hypothetical protein